MTRRLVQLIPTLALALCLMVAAGFAPGRDAPDRDDAARAASLQALGAGWSDLCGTTDPRHGSCPFCTLPGSPQTDRPTAVSAADLPDPHVGVTAHQILCAIHDRTRLKARAPPTTV